VSGGYYVADLIERTFMCQVCTCGVYNRAMELTATDFRKNLFQILDRALRGEAIEIAYKGSKIRLTPPQGGSKLARAVRRNTLLVPFDSIVESDPELVAELEKGWRRDDEDL